MTDKMIIQKEISITTKEINKCIEYYNSLPNAFRLGMTGVILDKVSIIKEIKQFSELGKEILLMRYNYIQWEAQRKQKLEDSE